MCFYRVWLPTCGTSVFFKCPIEHNIYGMYFRVWRRLPLYPIVIVESEVMG